MRDGLRIGPQNRPNLQLTTSSCHAMLWTDRYDDLLYLRSMREAAIDTLAADVGMKLGHVQKYKHMLAKERAALP